MHPGAEREIGDRCARDVDGVRVVAMRGIPAGRAVRQQHAIAARHLHAADFDVGLDPPRHVHDAEVEP
jgi:hypothetical protein